MEDFSFNDEGEEREKSNWAPLKYVNWKCPNCGRLRVEICANGKHWCEKCNWVVEDKEYFNSEWRL